MHMIVICQCWAEVRSYS